MEAQVDQFLLDCAAAAIEVPFSRYMDWVFESLGALLRFDSAGWGIGTHDPPVTHAIHLRGVPPAMLIAYNDGVVELDYIRAAAAAHPGITINDFDIRDAHQTAADAIDSRISAPFSLEQTLATSLPDSGGSGLHHFILLWRSRRFDPFNEAERQLKQRCVPHIVAGYRTAQRLHVATVAGASSVHGHALADEKGGLHSFDGRFVYLLRRRWPRWTGERLPQPLSDLLADGSAGTEARLPGLDISMERRGALVSIALSERRSDLLTPAQRRVADLYAAGLTHRQIAAELGLSSATVRNHIQQCFARLAVHSKLALADRLRALP